MGFGIVDIVNRRHDDTFIFHQVNRVVLTYCGACGDRGVLLLPRGLQLLQHGDDARLLVRLKDIVKRLQLEGFNRMLLPGGDEDNKRLMGKLIDVLRQ